MRLLLVKQDEISMLEHALDSLDKTENRELLLGCIRRDVNNERQKVIQNLSTALAEYGMYTFQLI